MYLRSLSVSNNSVYHSHHNHHLNFNQRQNQIELYLVLVVNILWDQMCNEGNIIFCVQFYAASKNITFIIFSMGCCGCHWLCFLCIATLVTLCHRHRNLFLRPKPEHYQKWEANISHLQAAVAFQQCHRQVVVLKSNGLFGSKILLIRAHRPLR